MTVMKFPIYIAPIERRQYPGSLCLSMAQYPDTVPRHNPIHPNHLHMLGKFCSLLIKDSNCIVVLFV